MPRPVITDSKALETLAGMAGRQASSRTAAKYGARQDTSWNYQIRLVDKDKKKPWTKSRAEIAAETDPKTTIKRLLSMQR